MKRIIPFVLITSMGSFAAPRGSAEDSELSRPSRLERMRLYQQRAEETGLQQLYDKWDQVTEFGNGRVSAQTLVAFQRLYGRTNVDPVIYRHLVGKVEAVASEHFAAPLNRPLSTVLHHDGSLIVPELSAFKYDRGLLEVADAIQKVHKNWSAVTSQINSPAGVRASSVDQFRAAVERLLSELDTAKFHRSLGFFRSKAHVRNLTSFAREFAENGEVADQVQRFLSPPAFTGGTMGELVHHMLDHRIGLRASSGQQLRFGRLVDAMIRQDVARQLDKEPVDYRDSLALN